MYVQTEETPNPNTMKFLPGKVVSEIGPVEFTNKNQTENKLIIDLLKVEGINMIFLGADFITVKKDDQKIWKNLKNEIIALINDYYLGGKSSIIEKKHVQEKKEEINDEVVKKIIDVLENNIRPAVAKDGGDIKFESFKNGVVTVQLQGSCSGCPSSMMTLKQGVQNLLCHYIPEVKRVEAR